MLSNIKNVITAIGVIKTLLGLIAPITELIHQVEQPGVSGAEKKDAVLSLIRAAMTTVSSAFSVPLPTELVVGFASDIIDVIVTIENALGRLKHSSTPTIIAPSPNPVSGDGVVAPNF